MSAFERVIEAPLGRPTASNPAARVGAALGAIASDVLEGLRYTSHHFLAAVGLVAVVLLGFWAGRPDLRHGLEDQALSWLSARAVARAEGGAAGAGEGAPDILLAMAEPEAIQRATAVNPAELSRQQAAVAHWIARRYSVAPEPVSRLVQEAWALGQRSGLEPTLLLAVMAVESGFNPFAQSHVGAQGLMQVMTRVHHDKYAIFGGQNAAFDPVTNLRVGVQVLQDCIRRAGSVAGGLKYYVGAANLSHDGGYGAKVLAEATHLRQVANGQKVAFNVSLPSASAPAPLVVPQAASSAEAAEPAQQVPSAGEVPHHAPVRSGEQVALLGSALAGR